MAVKRRAVQLRDRPPKVLHSRAAKRTDVAGNVSAYSENLCSTSAGDALLVDLAQVGDAAVVGAGPHALPVHGVPAEQRGLGDGELLHDA